MKKVPEASQGWRQNWIGFANALPADGPSRTVLAAAAFAVTFASTAYAATPPVRLYDSSDIDLAQSSSPSLYAANTPVPLSDTGAALPGPGVTGAAQAPSAPTTAAPGIPANPYANYRWKGIILSLPQPPNTIDLGLGGFRQNLADDYGIGYFGLSQTTFYDNVLHHSHSLRDAQAYVGQRATYLSQNFLNVTVDLSRYGIPDGQIDVNGAYTGLSWNPLGPNSINVGALTYYQTLFNKRLEIKFGLTPENLEFGPCV